MRLKDLVKIGFVVHYVCDTLSHTYLKQPEPDQIAAWASRGAGLFTDEILQTVRDPTSLGAQR